MRKANCLIMELKEFDEIIGAATDGLAGIANENGEWFYIAEENYDDSLILQDVRDYLGKDILKVYIDLNEMTVILYLE